VIEAVIVRFMAICATTSGGTGSRCGNDSLTHARGRPPDTEAA